jgi:hypothetical protein
MKSQNITLQDRAVALLDEWYDGLDLFINRLPSRGTIAAAAHVLGRLKADFNLDIEAHVSGKKAQIAGLSASSLQKTLAAFGETRPLSEVAGRSNRGGRGDIELLLERMKALGLERLTAKKRNAVLLAMQRRIVKTYIPRFHAAKRVKATFDEGNATWKFINGIVDNARKNGKGGAVAEHLVGAKLSLKFPPERFPEVSVRNKPSSAADVQAGFPGDFEIGDTVFHVTVAPMPALFEKCKENLSSGHRVYVLVPLSQWAGAFQQAELHAPGKMAVESMESFISTNIDEFAEFKGARMLKSGLRVLLERYNERVMEVETDKSLLIEIPKNLK